MRLCGALGDNLTKRVEEYEKKTLELRARCAVFKVRTGCIPGGDSEVENSGPRSFRTNGSCSNRLHATSSLIS
ncbi:hypothetical protein PsorP6_013332 [Peronosclerospora sorghi]|uniref:Uncharacterized protein n=1 Tax=Peronosclerospora sorghi TaxID=230839 RepID=A0ACC0WJ08_9STRA|nr:hypothetical protein PsorP6_013332 [Peronosclerospora sorghi]